MFELKHIKAVLRDPGLREELIESGSIPLEKYNFFDQQDLNTQNEIIENIDEIMQASAPFQALHPSPCEHLPDDAWIYGTKGVYVVRTQDGCVLFTRKADAVRYADEISKVSWEIAINEGWVEP